WRDSTSPASCSSPSARWPRDSSWPARSGRSSNQVARDQALARNVRELEATNANARREIASPRAQIDALESEAATRSSATPALKNQVCDLRADTGLVATHGPGVKLNVRNGVPGPVTGSRAGVAIDGVPVAPFMVSTRMS